LRGSEKATNLGDSRVLGAKTLTPSIDGEVVRLATTELMKDKLVVASSLKWS